MYTPFPSEIDLRNGWLVQHMKISVIYHINRKKGRKQMTIIVNAKKAFNKIQ